MTEPTWVLSNSKEYFNFCRLRESIPLDAELLNDVDSLKGRRGPATLVVLGAARHDYLQNREQVRQYCMTHNIKMRIRF